MNELNIYQTCQNILSKSSVIKGNFSVVPGYGADLNIEEVGEKITKEVKPKSYPLVALFPPVEIPKIKTSIFKMRFFFCLQQGNGSFGIKDILSNNTSGHSVLYDWKDMRECAMNFFNVLNEVSKITPKQFDISREANYIERFSDTGTAKLSGVSLSFDITLLNNTKCENEEYDITDLQQFLSTQNIHPQHKH